MLKVNLHSFCCHINEFFHEQNLVRDAPHGFRMKFLWLWSLINTSRLGLFQLPRLLWEVGGSLQDLLEESPINSAVTLRIFFQHYPESPHVFFKHMTKAKEGF